MLELWYSKSDPMTSVSYSTERARLLCFQIPALRACSVRRLPGQSLAHANLRNLQSRHAAIGSLPENLLGTFDQCHGRVLPHVAG